MFWMNFIKKYFLGSESDSEKSCDALQLILIGWGAEREVLPIEDLTTLTQY